MLEQPASLFRGQALERIAEKLHISIQDGIWFADYRRLRIVAYEKIAHDTGKTAPESWLYAAFDNRTIHGS